MLRLPIILVCSVLFFPPSKNPRVYDAPRALGRITIDGKLDDLGWAAAAWTEDFVDIQGTEAPAPPLRTRAKILWDDEQLYIGAEMEEPHLWATLMDRDAIIYRDDDFELFLDPEGDGLAYFELEINAMGTLFDLFLDKPYKKGGRAQIGWDAQGLRAEVALMGTLNDPTDEDRGWWVEMAIPWADLVPLASETAHVPAGTPGTRVTPGMGPAWTPGEAPRIGDTWRINFSRVDWPLEVVEGSYRKTESPTQENRHPEANWVWSPQGAIDMHIPEMWGVVRFVVDPQNSLFNKCP
jgi:hypothetical protein